MKITHYQILVRGRVQGVWFRKYTREKAKELMLAGFVRNEPDKEVYIEVEGIKEKLDQFVEWLHEGSPLSEVSEVICRIGKLKNFSSFEILR